MLGFCAAVGRWPAGEIWRKESGVEGIIKRWRNCIIIIIIIIIIIFEAREIVLFDPP